MPEQQQGGLFGNASPKLTFIFGLIAGLAVVSVIGFVVLLTGTLRSKGNTDDGGAPVVVAPSPTPSPTPAPEDQVGSFRPIDASRDHVRGDKDAKVSVIEYSDLECPFCKTFHNTMRETMDKYNGKVQWVYRHFPLAQLHSKAPKEAEAAECAASLGGNDSFWKYIDRVFAVTPSNNGLDAAELPKIAVAIGLNQKKFEDCLSSGKFTSKVQEDENDAVSAGGRGTPYSVVVAGDQKIPVSGAVPAFELQQILDQLVK